MAAAAIGSGGGMKRREGGGSCKLAGRHRRRKAAEAGVKRRRGDAAVVGDGGLTGWLRHGRWNIYEKLVWSTHIARSEDKWSNVFASCYGHISQLLNA